MPVKYKPFDLEEAKKGAKFVTKHNYLDSGRRFIGVLTDGQIVYEYCAHERSRDGKKFYDVTCRKPEELLMVVEPKIIKLRIYKRMDSETIICVEHRTWYAYNKYPEFWKCIDEFEREIDDVTS
jgi:hypothetical protein